MKYLKCIFAACTISTLLFSSSACQLSVASVPETTEEGNVYNGNYLVEINERNCVIISLPTALKVTPEIYALLKQKLVSFLQNTTGVVFDLSYADVSHEDSIDWQERQNTEYTIELNAKITFSNDDIISLVFDGMLNSHTAAHPLRLFYCINYSRSANAAVELTEICNLDDKLYEAFSQAVREKIEAQSDVVWWETQGELFLEEYCSKDAFYSGLSQDGAFTYYITDAGIGISFSVPHSIGDFVTVELKGQRVGLRE